METTEGGRERLSFSAQTPDRLRVGLLHRFGYIHQPRKIFWNDSRTHSPMEANDVSLPPVGEYRCIPCSF
jgi:hypothetical protein